MSVQIRPAVIEDLAALTDLYNHYIVNTPTTFDIEPYTLESRAVWFSQFDTTGRYRLLVVEQDDEVIGYACSSRFKPKRAYETSVEVSIYLDPNTKGRGLGTALYLELFELLEAEDVHRAYAGITLPNEASQIIHEKFGFESVGVYREVGRKFGQYWDVEWFEKTIG
ncbi:Phosphinothricin N-acetyltransferase [Marinomonas spartinae]|uniref:Phosphinothricin N-acetyltransferase n=1 Tax=Marinomonas spartinae TaxID=1792290 RepID=A0A1A8T3G9_9GAMM|nr:GNAT family N-acetyltransferase [Marinomonas spartinae]MBJ7554989.1 N-acetyltransferase [Marinomonas spartinae]SBS26365.1 Phosphinothricin N-acetyltransferase [Marinomonas spartinae]SBS40105.1 Phosphinothricin N-acetyltransferase [Marinomonas spartinae]